MSVGKRIYLKREMPDPEVMAQFKTIPVSNTADVMNRSCAMNPRIRLVSQTKDIKLAQAAAGHTTSAMTLRYYVKTCKPAKSCQDLKG